MKCPHCQARVGLFSDEVKRIGKSGACPQCGKPVKVGLLHLRFAAGFVAVMLAAFLMGMSSPLVAGLAGGVGAAVGMGLKRARVRLTTDVRAGARQSMMSRIASNRCLRLKNFGLGDAGWWMCTPPR